MDYLMAVLETETSQLMATLSSIILTRLGVKGTEGFQAKMHVKDYLKLLKTDVDGDGIVLTERTTQWSDLIKLVAHIN